MGHPTSPKETRSLIAKLLAAIEDPTNPPTDDERDQLVTSANRWLELEEQEPLPVGPGTMAEQLRAWALILHPYTNNPDLMGVCAGMKEVAADIETPSETPVLEGVTSEEHAYCGLLALEREWIENTDCVVQVTNEGEDIAIRDPNGRDIWALCWYKLPRWT